MADNKPFSRADLVAISGAPDDAVAFWLRNGLLGDDDRAARKHRRFSVREVKLAALLREARRMGLNINAMRAILGSIQEAFRFRDQFSDEMTLEKMQDSEIVLNGGRRASQLLYLAYQIDHCENLLVVYQTSDDLWHASAESLLDERLPSSAAVVFDLRKVLSLDWPKEGGQ